MSDARSTAVMEAHHPSMMEEAAVLALLYRTELAGEDILRRRLESYERGLKQCRGWRVSLAGMAVSVQSTATPDRKMSAHAESAAMAAVPKLFSALPWGSALPVAMHHPDGWEYSARVRFMESHEAKAAGLGDEPVFLMESVECKVHPPADEL